MKKLFFTTAFLILAVVISAQPPAGPANKGMTFGDVTSEKGAIHINSLAEKVKTEEEIRVKVKGKVTDVCTMEGCWLKMQTADGKVMVKMKDHSFFVPLDLNGKEVVVDGLAKIKLTSVKELQHYAKDAGATKEEIAKITHPKKEIVINARGILVL